MSSTTPSGVSQAAHQTSKPVWLATAVIMAGSVVTGIGLIEWIWPMFWAGIAMMAVGALAALAAGIMSQVSEYGAGAPPAP